MTQSEQLFQEALHYIPGGVNSPVRAFRSVGGIPRIIESAEGAYLTDVDGRRYIDYIGSWGPMILGHRHPAVISAVKNAVDKGLSFGAPNKLELQLAKKICDWMPSIEKIRMMNSGTEATMTALRLARGFTHRDYIVKFEGCYHGHADSLLVKAGSGALTCGVPTSQGVPASIAQYTLTATFNDLNSVTRLFEERPNDIAAIIVEPIPGNMNLILPHKHFLQELRKICDHYGALLIIDEVMTGFRVAKGGAQSLYKVKPDLTTLGKIMGGGMPVGALGGRREIMDYLAPLGPVYQAGTLSGNPVAMAAGLSTLEQIEKDPQFYQTLSLQTEQLIHGILARAKAAKIPMIANCVPGMFGLFFTNAESITSYQSVMQCNAERFNAFFHAMLDKGVYLAPSMFEAGFVSIAHKEAEINATLTAVEKSLARLVENAK